ncbi:MAG: hypothetical protein QXM31_03465 [Candidatus Woesearchaeota archaeon]
MDTPPQQEQPNSETQVLGGNIELTGFRELDGGSMIVLKKIIGNYARRFSDNYGNEKMSLSISRNADQFALSASVLCKGNKITVDHADKNIFFLVDAVLKRIEQEISK